MINLLIAVSPLVHTNGGEATIEIKMFRDEVLIDPEELDVTITDPDGVETVFQWPDDGVTHVATGTFTLTTLLTDSGRWTVNAVASTPDAAATYSWTVRPKMETVTISVFDDAADAVLSEVVVSVVNFSGGIIASGTSNDDGEVTLRVAPGTYDVTGYKKKVSFPAATMTIADTEDTEPQLYTLQGAALTISSVTTMRRVRVFGQVFGSDGRAVPNVRVKLFTQGSTFAAPQTSITGIDAQSVMLFSESRETITSEDGYWEMDLAADALVRIEVGEVGYSKEFRVPSDPNVTVFNLRDAHASLEVSQR